jgi:hypothetical protein
MGSSAMLYILNFIKIGSGTQKMSSWAHFYFFQNRESKKKLALRHTIIWSLEMFTSRITSCDSEWKVRFCFMNLSIHFSHGLCFCRICSLHYRDDTTVQKVNSQYYHSRFIDLDKVCGFYLFSCV